MGEEGIRTSDMQQILKEMKSLRINVEGMIKDQAFHFNEELSKLRAELVSRVEFQGLEERVKVLETGGLASSEIAWMQQQVNRLDPANRSLAFTGLKSTSANGRVALIESFLKISGGDPKIQNIEYVWKGPPGDRSMSSLCIVELTCRNERESVLKKLEKDKTTMHEGDANVISVQRAKTAFQLKRNASLKKALEILKKVSRSIGQTVEIDWQIPGSKTRVVNVGGVKAFEQLKDDAAGKFVSKYEDVLLL